MTDLRPLGRSGLSTPPLVLGGNVFGWTADRKASFAVLDAFVAGGGVMIDSADIYSNWVPGNRGGESETMIGEWLKRRGHRDDVLITSKMGSLPGEGGKGLASSRITVAIEDSLRRLGVDHIDFYYAHRDDPTQPQEVVLATFDSLVKAGKVRHIAASNYAAPRLASALDISKEMGLARFELLQPQLNLMVRSDFPADLQRLCIDRSLGVLPYFALASGFLTGKYRSAEDAEGKGRGAEAKSHMNPRGFAVLAAMDAVAEENGASLSQIALAWIAAQPGVTAPIASATTVGQVEELLGAMRLKLTPEQIDRLDEASRTPL